jgi:hypothetical protein
MSDFKHVPVIRVLAFLWLCRLQEDLFFGDFWLLTIEGRASRAEPVAIVLCLCRHQNGTFYSSVDVFPGCCSVRDIQTPYSLP